jgi:hypothetical protein
LADLLASSVLAVGDTMKTRTVHYFVLRALAAGSWEEAERRARISIKAKCFDVYVPDAVVEWQRCYSPIPHVAAHVVTYA